MADRAHVELKVSDSEGEEDVFDRFTEPKKKRKRKAARKDKKVKRRLANFMAGKLLAADCFNDAPTEAERALWSKQTLPVRLAQSELEAWLERVEPDDIKFERWPNRSGLLAAYELFDACDFCKNWFEVQLRRVGWRMNMTGYHPASRCHSTNELLFAYAEALKMAIKQMLLLVRSQAGGSADKEEAS